MDVSCSDIAKAKPARRGGEGSIFDTAALCDGLDVVTFARSDSILCSNCLERSRTWSSRDSGEIAVSRKLLRDKISRETSSMHLNPSSSSLKRWVQRSGSLRKFAEY